MSKITKDLVFQLANELSLAGLAITNLAIRQRNDNSGSLSSIAPLLKEWKEERMQQEDQAESMPEELILNTIKPLWAVLKKQSRIELAEKTELFKIKETEFNAEKDQFIAEFDRHEELILEQDNKLTESKLSIDSLSKELEKTRLEKGALEKNETLLTSENDKLTKSSVELNNQLSRSQASNDALKEQAEKVELERSNLSKDLASALTEVAVIKERNNQIDAKYNEQIQKNKEIVDASEINKKELNRALEKSENKVKDQKQTLQLKEVELSKLINKMKVDKDHHQTKLDEIASLSVKNAHLERINSNLQDNVLELSKVNKDSQIKK